MKFESGEYVWYRLDGSKYGFSSAGKLLWLDDEKGNRLEVEHDVNGLPLTVTDLASGRELTFHYQDGLLESISARIKVTGIDLLVDMNGGFVARAVCSCAI